MLKMSNSTFDVWKEIAQIWIPALSTLYFTLSGIWGLPYAEQICGTLAALDVFLGAILKISTYQYNKEDEGKVTFYAYDEEDDEDDREGH